MTAERRVTIERERQRRLFEQAPGLMAVLAEPELRFECVQPVDVVPMQPV